MVFYICESPALGAIFCLWEPRPRGDGWWSAGLIATRASLLQGYCAAFCRSPALGAIVCICVCGCRSPALGAMGGGLQDLSRRGRRSYRDMALHFVGQGSASHLWEPRPRGDCLWSARLIATRASLLQGHGPAFCGTCPCILWEPCPRGDGWWCARVFATGASLLQKIAAGVPVVQLKDPANFAGPIQPSGHGHKLVTVARGRDGTEGREREVETAGHHFFLDQHVKYTATGLTRHFGVHVKQHGPVGVAGKQ